jgi:hypothetical protein
MPRTISTTVYTFDELTDEKAKERAREWYREASASDFSDFHADSMYDDFQECAERLGITFATRGRKLMNGTMRQDPDIEWSGFWSQGDGLSYAGTYQYRKDSRKLILAHAPQDTELHRIADALYDIQRKHFFSLTASITKEGRYSHSGTMSVTIEDAKGNEPAEFDEMRTLFRDFADWMYQQLEKEYEYQNSDEVVDENIVANEYTFTADGERFD